MPHGSDMLTDTLLLDRLKFNSQASLSISAPCPGKDMRAQAAIPFSKSRNFRSQTYGGETKTDYIIRCWKPMYKPSVLQMIHSNEHCQEYDMYSPAFQRQGFAYKMVSSCYGLVNTDIPTMTPLPLAYLVII